MPAVLMQFGIVNAIRNLCDDVSDISHIRIKFSSENISEQLDDRYKTYLYRITQEALNNIIKHSKATEAVIELKATGDSIFLNIFDNGIGFNPENVPINGKGIHNINERVNLLHGTIRYETKPGRGTKIFIKL